PWRHERRSVTAGCGDDLQGAVVERRVVERDLRAVRAEGRIPVEAAAVRAAVVGHTTCLAAVGMNGLDVGRQAVSQVTGEVARRIGDGRSVTRPRGRLEIAQIVRELDSGTAAGRDAE